MRWRRAKFSMSGCGADSTAASGVMPRATQPLRSALPIRPAPPSSVTPAARSGLAGTLENGGRDGFLSRLATPEDELKRRIVMFAGFHSEIEQGFALGSAGARIGKYHRMAEDERALVRKQIEMSDPELGVNVHEQRGHLAAPRGFHPHVEGGGKMKRLHVLPPGDAEMMVAPAPGHREVQLVAPAALERPAMVFHRLLEHVERMEFDDRFFLLG